MKGSEEQCMDVPNLSGGVRTRARPLHVLFVNATAELGGTDTRLCETVCSLDPTIVRPFVVLPSPGPFDSFYRDRGVPLFHLPLPVPGKRLGPAQACRLVRHAI